ncbi:hypothetical protein BJ138DRAFT_1133142 [Hygrophoropsis aurantiaca]|uniref:Uncharacterized protein n=1 Tax=Hygrophoropsis aurantiaca TaxID=72124 RepID=A0ACB8ANL3_9AGAM|nr:hypothetical protein BJ138DRAFT_1133142 [Hygrophoropsis aurantiaca]
MADSPRRLSFPTSSSDFALPSSSSTPEDVPTIPLLARFRRPTLSSKPSYLSDKKIHSPLAVSFTIPSRRLGSTNGEESESDKERMYTESSPSSSSGNPTPPIGLSQDSDADDFNGISGKEIAQPSTPPPSRNLGSGTLEQDNLDAPSTLSVPRRPAYPLKPPRILNLLAESRPDEDEVKSEAAFQRLIASCSELPMQPRTPRAPSDRGRYPEEAGHEESQREDTPSEDEDDDIEGLFAYDTQSEPITIKPCTPAQSVNGDELSMSISGSPMSGAMDVDVPTASPSITSTPISIQWRYTPPPTTSAVRSNKRKVEDRYDPYPTSAKRRAVSPSISHLREAHSYPRTPNARPVPIPLPLSIPGSTMGSVTSSPTVTSYSLNGLAGSRTSFGAMSVSSSPILRPTLGLASPILRPIPRNRRAVDGEEREVEGAGEAVGGLSLS